MRKWLRDFIGTTDIGNTLFSTRERVKAIEDQLAVILEGTGRIVAKVDPNFTRSEFDPERIAESNRMGKQAIARLLGEHMAQQHTEGKL